MQAEEGQSEVIDHKMIKAFAHPVRARALIILSDRIASPKEIAAELDEPIGKVSYHVRELEKAGLIELVDTDGSRGGVQHFYRATGMALITDEESSRLTLAERQAVSAIVIHLILADVGASVSAGLFDRQIGRHLSRTSMLVDEQGWAELEEIFNATTTSVLEVRAACERRRAVSKEPGTPVRAAAMFFEMPDA